MFDLTGKTLSRYQILEKIGEGGMATVYKAHDTRLDTDVALKIIRTDNLPPYLADQTLKRFEREAKVLARLTHPNIVKVSDFGQYEDKPYLVMSYLSGGTLSDRMKNGRMEWDVAARLLLPIARALEYAHKENLIHRDIKPANILFTLTGQPMLSDFGLVKVIGLASGASLTGTGVGMGTPEYMAPEQWIGESVPQSDMYSLGIVFFEMITGRKPYVADTPASLFIKQSNDPLPSVSDIVPLLPYDADYFLDKALAKKPEYRFANMTEFCAGLEELLDKNTQPAPYTKLDVKTAEVEELLSKNEMPRTPIPEVSQPYPSNPAPKVQSTPPRRSFLAWAIWGGIALVGLAFICVFGAAIAFFFLTSRTVGVATSTPLPTAQIIFTPTVEVPTVGADLSSPIPEFTPTVIALASEASPTSENSSLCASPTITSREGPKGMYLTICTTEFGIYELGPLANGDFAIGPTNGFFIYCDVTGAVYAARFGDKTFTTIGSVKEFYVIRNVSDVPKFSFRFIDDTSYKVIVTEEKSGEKKTISIPHVFTDTR